MSEKINIKSTFVNLHEDGTVWIGGDFVEQNHNTIMKLGRGTMHQGVFLSWFEYPIKNVLFMLFHEGV